MRRDLRFWVASCDFARYLICMTTQQVRADMRPPHVDSSDDEIEDQILVKLDRGASSLWEPREGAAVCVVNRFKEDGGRARCELYEPETGQWLDRFPVPMTREFVLSKWGSGVYQMFYHQSDGKAAGQSRRIELAHADFPQLPMRSGGVKALRAPVAPPPAPVPIRGPNFTPKAPPLPTGTDGAVVMGLLSWAQEIADARADQRIISTELYWQTQLAREQAQRQRDIEETEQRHRRDREETEARHQRYLGEIKAMHDSQLHAAHSTSGKKELLERLEEMEDALEETKKPEEAGFLGFLKGALGPILASPEGQARALAALQHLITPGPPKIG